MDKKKSVQEKNIDYFYKNLNKFLQNQKLFGKYLVINKCEIIESFDNFASALKFAAGNLPENEYIIQEVIDEEEKVNFLCSVER